MTLQVAEESMQRWADVERNTGAEIAVASDCSWVTRGFAALFGVTSILSARLGKVLDYYIASKHCQTCPQLGESEADMEHDCDANFEGASGTMESTSMLTLFERSREKLNLT